MRTSSLKLETPPAKYIRCDSTPASYRPKMASLACARTGIMVFSIARYGESSVRTLYRPGSQGDAACQSSGEALKPRVHRHGALHGIPGETIPLTSEIPQTNSHCRAAR